MAIHGTSWHHGVNPCALQAITIVGGEQFCTYTGYARSLAFLGADSRHFILALHRITVLCVCCFFSTEVPKMIDVLMMLLIK